MSIIANNLFAVGSPRQPLPNAACIANTSLPGGTGACATGATTRSNLKLTYLRPETLQVRPANTLPTANIFSTDNTRGPAG
jgi:hypothetical protein